MNLGDELQEWSELPKGLSWNEFQKYYRGVQNQKTAKLWAQYQQRNGGHKDEATKGPPRPKPKARSKEVDVKMRIPAPAAVLTAGRSGRVRKANSLYCGGAFAVDTKAAAMPDQLAASADQMAASMRPWAGLLARMMERRDARPFSRPMKELWDEGELEDYFQIVKRPIDLGTIKSNLLCGMYNDPAKGALELAADVRRVFDNCQAFTPDTESTYYQQAARLRTFFENEWTALVGAEVSQVKASAETNTAAPTTRPSATTAAGASAGANADPMPTEVPTTTTGRAPPSFAGQAPRGHGTAQPKKRSPQEELSQSQKNDIIERLGQLKRRKLRHALDIVNRGDPQVRDNMEETAEGEEYELDLDTLPKDVLWSLHEYRHVCCFSHNAAVSLSDFARIPLVSRQTRQ